MLDDHQILGHGLTTNLYLLALSIYGFGVFLLDLAQTYSMPFMPLNWYVMITQNYNETVQHRTLREPACHICATTGKLCISQHTSGGLQRSMFHPQIALEPNDICLTSINRDDEICHEAQWYWIAEAIRYIHPDAIKKLFRDNLTDQWPQFQCRSTASS